ncbi:hypothetical protein GGTG_12103 [Gaeumannomyces tritici R3-111a-1]|uniref:Uncharacterized protein n=1 Tax=Gaeumannomyces tritici (strain R3-111a-1) TaxID=644352 RepID=J3PF24_GAET3|nr:hypothetical protein GGTG_12103 [Gaeumannomyces tritici R3-111a-1]EJT71082.1 hypothetical protein GGTG_12103 [Gaeumannomyces tritici R3-111a-1]
MTALRLVRCKRAASAPTLPARNSGDVVPFIALEEHWLSTDETELQGLRDRVPRLVEVGPERTAAMVEGNVAVQVVSHAATSQSAMRMAPEVRAANDNYAWIETNLLLGRQLFLVGHQKYLLQEEAPVACVCGACGRVDQRRGIHGIVSTGMPERGWCASPAWRDRRSRGAIWPGG